ncbi:hypothetical protein GOP47_0020592 [Adiantum capillus-veneris]|uniref:Uncharacterized protein n=1 Tax=Adiantum capillus-veneris TaxID=13818 RepID=A0A9D4Z7W1_ADICA|nr:hypothetical protein GOP47_0020592 [Adiantum capillus-veneris]
MWVRYDMYVKHNANDIIAADNVRGPIEVGCINGADYVKGGQSRSHPCKSLRMGWIGWIGEWVVKARSRRRHRHNCTMMEPIKANSTYGADEPRRSRVIGPHGWTCEPCEDQRVREERTTVDFIVMGLIAWTRSMGRARVRQWDGMD